MLTPQRRYGLGDFSALARAIFRMEGVLDKNGNWVTGTVGYQLNNPGNLVWAGQTGAHPVERYDPVMQKKQVYASWNTLEEGIAGTEKQLALDASRGLTLEQRLGTWATHNRTAYISNVSSWLGVAPGTPLETLRNYGAPPGSFLSAPPRPRRSRSRSSTGGAKKKA